MKPNKSSSSPCCVLKGSLYTLTTLHLHTCDLTRLSEQLSQSLAQAPKFFDHTPIVVDIQALPNLIDMAALANCLRSHHLIPVGIRGGSTEQRAAAKTAGLALLPETTRTTDTASAPNTAATAHPAQTKLITQPVRSGQQIYAEGGDLIVLAPVSAGAELLADGNIHVYAPLRGRALAGVLGNKQARIFCQHLEAELIAIAGHYQVSEQLKDHPSWEKNVTIHLTNEHLTLQVFA